MHPRFATVLDGLPGEVLLRPDWRVEFDPQVSASAEHDHHVGIPVAMVETLAHQYELAAVHLERAAYTFRSASGAPRSMPPCRPNAKRSCANATATRSTSCASCRSTCPSCRRRGA